jgi:hypothetical protein
MEARFDIYLSGKLADGVTPAAAAAAMAQLFRSTPEAMAAMLDGKPRLLKRDVDHPTALKYRDALQRAGVLVAFRPFTRTASETPPQPSAAPAAPAQPTPATAASAAPSTATPGLTLAPADGDLLRPDERATVVAVAVDTSHLQVEAPGELPRLPVAPPAPPPDTSHLSVAEVGADLAPARPQATPVALSAAMAAMTLAEVGAPLETLHSELPAIVPDTSALSLAEPGELLHPDERRRAAPPTPPPTDHLHLV